MKRNLVLIGIVSLVVCFTVLFMTGCAKQGVIQEEAAVEQAAAPEQETVDQAALDKAKEEAALKEKAAREEAERALAEKERMMKEMAAKEAAGKAGKEEKTLADINFDFDKYNLKPEAREILKDHAAWLTKNTDFKLVIEGHCDERGTTEYNLALGERRAAEAMKYLVELGVASKGIKTISYGEEKPLDPGHTEEAWAKNRRDHFVLTPQK